MPKKYQLKNKVSSPENIQRLLKNILNNAEEDRSSANDLLGKVKEVVSTLETPIEVNGVTSLSTADAFTKLIQTAVLALNQMGIANERLIKLATVMQKINSDDSKNSPKEAPGSFFSKLKDFSKDDTD